MTYKDELMPHELLLLKNFLFPPIFFSSAAFIVPFGAVIFYERLLYV